ncbi:hypothetical protein FQN54_001204 [Arachnomyces sp. PD_36]|nr:hypothetical protein FQN54_001204 [Arachnomyces sp. PD_36]
MAIKTAIKTDNAPPPLPFFSQAIKCNGMIYCSGNVGVDPKTKQMAQGGVGERTVRIEPSQTCLIALPRSLKESRIPGTAQTLRNMSAVLEAGGSSLQNVVKINIFLSSMEDFAAMNKVYATFFSQEPKPARTCVAVKELPFKTDVEIECTAHIDTGANTIEGFKIEEMGVPQGSLPTSKPAKHPWMGQEKFEQILREVEERVSTSLDGHELPPADYGLQYFKPQPKLPRTDLEFERETRSLKHNIKKYCKEYYGYQVTDEERKAFNLANLAQKNPELMEFVEYVADGGDNWKDLFTSGLYRWNLAYGVLCFVLQKWVFSHTMFGATEEQLSSVQKIDMQFLMRDAFERTRVRSTIIKTFLSSHHSPVTQNFFNDANTLTQRTHLLLLPLLAIHRPGTAFQPAPEKNYDIHALNGLFPIIYQAAKLSLDMRREGPQIYFFRSILKREPWDEEAMSCKNKIEIEDEDPRRDKTHVRLVKITGFPEVMAYLPGRVGIAAVEKGGMELGYEQEGIGRNNWFEYDNTYDPARCRNHRNGFTARRICRATVLLDWGPLGRSNFGRPSPVTLAMAIEEDLKKNQQREEEDRQEKVDWWTRYAQLPAWGVGAGITGGLLREVASKS